MGNADRDLVSQDIPWMARPWSMELTLPPLAVLVLKPE